MSAEPKPISDDEGPTRYTRVLRRDDHIESSSETCELAVNGTAIDIASPIKMRITLLSAGGDNRARVLIEADREVRLEHVPAKAGMVNRKKPR